MPGFFCFKHTDKKYFFLSYFPLKMKLADDISLCKLCKRLSLLIPDRTKQAQEIIFFRRKNATTHPLHFFNNSEAQFKSEPSETYSR